ncbi:hypothetical protein AvCA_23240 [Azotobacter vinelandii CA]|uniref:Uncharacterized protein n=2 Tax=Azotobacter vinelandii TaxID=354 RepID=C1DHB7_AZOVD|nr:hypothetical protein Avin_23240 [Azotobacter vinelandii DJ]AGK16705.1 hypothetical protein AvCA_23240 [Azotobacter vinelandii CA]AGK20564.1 hypothetical protein AvCA6_23240 [Azotobacter vinelandii CA6]
MSHGSLVLMRPCHRMVARKGMQMPVYPSRRARDG